MPYALCVSCTMYTVCLCLHIAFATSLLNIMDGINVPTQCYKAHTTTHIHIDKCVSKCDTQARWNTESLHINNYTHPLYLRMHVVHMARRARVANRTLPGRDWFYVASLRACVTVY